MLALTACKDVRTMVIELWFSNNFWIDLITPARNSYLSQSLFIYMYIAFTCPFPHLCYWMVQNMIFVVVLMDGQMLNKQVDIRRRRIQEKSKDSRNWSLPVPVLIFNFYWWWRHWHWIVVILLSVLTITYLRR